MKGILHILYFISFVLILVSCSSTKFVGNGEYLLDKVEIITDTKSYKSNELKPWLWSNDVYTERIFGLWLFTKCKSSVRNLKIEIIK